MGFPRGNSNPVTGTRVTRSARAKTCRIPGGNNLSPRTSRAVRLRGPQVRVVSLQRPHVFFSTARVVLVRGSRTREHVAARSSARARDRLTRTTEAEARRTRARLAARARRRSSPYDRFGSAGDQAKGMTNLTPLRVTLRSRLPSAFMTWSSSPEGRWSRSKAIICPSGDQRGPSRSPDRVSASAVRSRRRS